MMLGLILPLCIASFLIAFIGTPSWIRRARENDFVREDAHKKGKPKVPEMGGVAVILGAMFSVLIYVAFDTFLFEKENVKLVLAALTSITLAFAIGMVDDMLGGIIGLKRYEKALLTLLVPIPLVVVNAGVSSMIFPFLGEVDLGLLYPLVVIPVIVIGATNGFNLLRGYNGLEAGMGIIILSVLGWLALETGGIAAAIISFAFVSALLAFLFYNRYPARVFPGSVLTYSIGAAISVVAILGNLERFAAMLFFIFFIDLFLKARAHFKQEQRVKVLEDGSLSVDGVYSIPHLVIRFLTRVKGRAYENEVVATILGFQIIIAGLVIGNFYRIF